jgi:hypothetical protein
MPIQSEETFKAWSKPSSETEQTKCENAESAIRKAVNNYPQLTSHDKRIFAHGSYRNNTNVRQNSDVDIIVFSKDTYFPNFIYSEGLSTSDINGFEPATYQYAEFKNDVHQALIAYFGAERIKTGNKAFDVDANTYHVEADVVAAFEHRRYKPRTRPFSTLEYDSGIEFIAANGQHVVNWPDQHYSRGVRKNLETTNYFKFVTRILKRVRYEMKDEGISAADGLSSFIIECMVHNVPNQHFRNHTYSADVREVLAFLWNGTMEQSGCDEWTEVSGMEWLFRYDEPKRQAAFNWVKAAWNYLELE